MKKSHEGRVAVVTGSARGIGQAIAIALAENGASLALLDVDAATETAELVRKAGAEVIEVKTDVTSQQAWEAAAAAVKSRFGRADILVNNAGIYPFVALEELSYEVWSRVMKINLDGPFLGTKAFLPLMKAQNWGRIVNLSSASVWTETPGFVHYIASKMGVIGLTRALSNELGRYNIAVNAVAPSVTNTPGTSMAPDEMKRAVWSRQPIARFGQPADLVGPILFLTSEASGFVTGQTLVVDGGLVKH